MKQGFEIYNNAPILDKTLKYWSNTQLLYQYPINIQAYYLLPITYCLLAIPYWLLAIGYCLYIFARCFLLDQQAAGKLTEEALRSAQFSDPHRSRSARAQQRKATRKICEHIYEILYKSILGPTTFFGCVPYICQMWYIGLDSERS